MQSGASLKTWAVICTLIFGSAAAVIGVPYLLAHKPEVVAQSNDTGSITRTPSTVVPATDALPPPVTPNPPAPVTTTLRNRRELLPGEQCLGNTIVAVDIKAGSAIQLLQDGAPVRCGEEIVPSATTNTAPSFPEHPYIETDTPRATAPPDYSDAALTEAPPVTYANSYYYGGAALERDRKKENEHRTEQKPPVQSTARAIEISRAERPKPAQQETQPAPPPAARGHLQL